MISSVIVDVELWHSLKLLVHVTQREYTCASIFSGIYRDDLDNRAQVVVNVKFAEPPEMVDVVDPAMPAYPKDMMRIMSCCRRFDGVCAGGTQSDEHSGVVRKAVKYLLKHSRGQGPS